MFPIQVAPEKQQQRYNVTTQQHIWHPAHRTHTQHTYIKTSLPSVTIYIKTIEIKHTIYIHIMYTHIISHHITIWNIKSRKRLSKHTWYPLFWTFQILSPSHTTTHTSTYTTNITYLYNNTFRTQLSHSSATQTQHTLFWTYNFTHKAALHTHTSHQPETTAINSWLYQLQLHINYLRKLIRSCVLFLLDHWTVFRASLNYFSTISSYFPTEKHIN